ncbi:MAG: DUF2505 domain-containing protein [Marmoricola sp.]
MKTIDHDLRYDGARADQVHEMLADPAFRERVLDAQGVLGRTVTITPSGAGMSVVLDQTQATRGMPGFAKKLVGDTVNVVQREEWSSATEGTVSVVVPGRPGEMKGRVTLAEDATGTTENVRLEVKVSIPLVGGKLEGLVAGLLTKALRAENTVGREWLGRQG